ncbi:hypothetical protein OD91_0225 [Lutibacter sp. Hel_I_33_5]|uniref:hypothetical protein n=1 Tax=Lutibacter sp. Hel_I_33_5 TaxID=1566289 RepID=UPI0011A32F1D|nr:hypothetical protein [Lutibacter sp. Hel_I_33_5]TVZ54986.1 hypothetical protein OD91_0225 [Lutibacter sp. Hel_I_33_5]
MQTNKIDIQIAEKLKNRTLQPSDSAWERLSSQLDAQQTKKKPNWFLYLGYAASIALLISVGFYFFNGNDKINPVKEIIVASPIDTLQFDNSVLKQITPVEEAIVDVKNKKEISTRAQSKGIKDENSISKNNISISKENKRGATKKDKTVIASIDNSNSSEVINKSVIASVKMQSVKKETSTSSIKINSDDLLFAVTHTEEEVKTYYAKYNVNRDDVLKTIKSELKKSNLSIDPNTILAEVERDIDEDVFKNNFMSTLKSKISGIASAIASRNN